MLLVLDIKTENSQTLVKIRGNYNRKYRLNREFNFSSDPYYLAACVTDYRFTPIKYSKVLDELIAYGAYVWRQGDVIGDKFSSDIAYIISEHIIENSSVDNWGISYANDNDPQIKNLLNYHKDSIFSCLQNYLKNVPDYSLQNDWERIQDLLLRSLIKGKWAAARLFRRRRRFIYCHNKLVEEFISLLESNPSEEQAYLNFKVEDLDIYIVKRYKDIKAHENKTRLTKQQHRSSKTKRIR